MREELEISPMKAEGFDYNLGKSGEEIVRMCGKWREIPENEIEKDEDLRTLQMEDHGDCCDECGADLEKRLRENCEECGEEYFREDYELALVGNDVVSLFLFMSYEFDCPSVL